jgi:hypothetical protein
MSAFFGRKTNTGKRQERQTPVKDTGKRQDQMQTQDQLFLHIGGERFLWQTQVFLYSFRNNIPTISTNRGREEPRLPEG